MTRGPLTGIRGGWENASAEDIQQLLTRWENSSLSLLRQGHSSLLQMVMMAWYSRPEAWAHCGYPGPLKTSQDFKLLEDQAYTSLIRKVSGE